MEHYHSLVRRRRRVLSSMLGGAVSNYLYPSSMTLLNKDFATGDATNWTLFGTGVDVINTSGQYGMVAHPEGLYYVTVPTGLMADFGANQNIAPTSGAKAMSIDIDMISAHNLDDYMEMTIWFYDGVGATISHAVSPKLKSGAIDTWATVTAFDYLIIPEGTADIKFEVRSRSGGGSNDTIGFTMLDIVYTYDGIIPVNNEFIGGLTTGWTLSSTGGGLVGAQDTGGYYGIIAHQSNINYVTVTDLPCESMDLYTTVDIPSEFYGGDYKIALGADVIESFIADDPMYAEILFYDSGDALITNEGGESEATFMSPEDEWLKFPLIYYDIPASARKVRLRMRSALLNGSGVYHGYTRLFGAVRPTTLTDLTQLFEAGEEGFLLLADADKYQTTDTSTPATLLNDPVRRMDDQSGNGHNAITANDANRPLLGLTPDSIDHDQVNDNFQITIPTGGFSGTFIIGTTDCTAAFAATIPAGTYSLSGANVYMTGNGEVVGVIMRDGVMTPNEIANAKALLVAKGAGVGFPAVPGRSFSNFNHITSVINPGIDASVTSLQDTFRSMGGCTLFDFREDDLSNVTMFSYAFFASNIATEVYIENITPTNIGHMFRNLYALGPTLDITTWDLSALTTGASFCREARELVTINCIRGDTSNVFNCPCTQWINAFLNCKLDQDTVNNILIGLDAAGTSNGTLGLNSGTSAAPSGAGATAKANLQGRGWTVSTN